MSLPIKFLFSLLPLQRSGETRHNGTPFSVWFLAQALSCLPPLSQKCCYSIAGLMLDPRMGQLRCSERELQSSIQSPPMHHNATAYIHLTLPFVIPLFLYSNFTLVLAFKALFDTLKRSTAQTSYTFKKLNIDVWDLSPWTHLWLQHTATQATGGEWKIWLHPRIAQRVQRRVTLLCPSYSFHLAAHVPRCCIITNS